MSTESQIISAADDRSGQRDSVLDVVVRWHHHGGIGDYRIAQITGIAHSDVKARRSELREEGLVYDSGEIEHANPASKQSQAKWILGDDRVRVYLHRRRSITNQQRRNARLWDNLSREQQIEIARALGKGR